MSDRKVYDTSQIRSVGDQFTRASQDSQTLLTNLQNLVTNLQGSFTGVAAQRFYSHFSDQATQLRTYVHLYEDIGTELKQLADRIESFDQALITG